MNVPDEVDFKDAAPALHDKTQNNNILSSLAQGIVKYQNRFFYKDGFFSGIFNINSISGLIGNEDDNKISKEDYMNLAGYAYDKYIQSKTKENPNDPESTPTGGTRRKRSLKSKKKVSKKKKVKTRRRK